MAFFRLRSHAGNRWPTLPDAGLSQVWAAYQQLEHTQWLGPDEIQALQLFQFRSLLGHCVANIPYYRDLFSASGITPASIRDYTEFRKVPLLDRRTCQERSDQLSTEVLPSGTVSLDEDSTSGASGVPVRVLKTNIYYVWWLACYLRDLEWSGLDPTGTMAVIRATFKDDAERDSYLRGVQLPCWQPVLDRLIESGPLHAMDIAQEPRRQLDWLVAVNPDFLLSHASNLELLAGILLEEPRRFPRLRAIQAISETLTEAAEERIRTAFGVPVKNLYSCAEAGYLASPCPAGHGMHVHAENVIFEVLDEDDRPCGPGETGRVVLTTLHNFRHSFIRYDIGDRVTLGPVACPCGRGLPALTRVEGKKRPHFRLSGGRVKHSSGLIHAISAVGCHHQHQVVQKALDHVIVRIVPARAWTPDSTATLRQAVEEFFESPIRIDVEIRDRLEVPRSGKLQSMICEVPGTVS
jgi:phenylacetate-CoA ligase